MAQKTIYVCDHCKVEVEQKYGVPTEFMYISVDLRRDGSRGVHRSKSFHVCPSCQEKIGFVKPRTDDKPAELAPSTADQLYDLVAQIVQENLPS